MNNDRHPYITCIGASLTDLNFYFLKEPLLHTSNPASVFKSPGGVVRNIAHHLAQLGNKVELISLFGDDSDGHWLKNVCHETGMSLAHSETRQEQTGMFASFLGPSGELFIGSVAADINLNLDRQFLETRSEVIKKSSMVVADCNLTTEALKWLIYFCNENNLPLVVETVSVLKAQRLMESLPGNILLIKPNQEEISILKNSTARSSENDLVESLHNQGINYVWLSRAEKGSLLSDKNNSWELPAPSVRIADTSGAGDAATAGWIHAWLQGKDPGECLRTGHALAALILETKGAIRADLSEKLLKSSISKK